MTYLPEESQIIYRSKDNRQEKIFDALDWLAAMTSHIPDSDSQLPFDEGPPDQDFGASSDRWPD